MSAGLSALADLDATGLTSAEQAGRLRALERAQAQLVAARSAVLAAFTAAGAFQDDAAGGPRSWLQWGYYLVRPERSPGRSGAA